MTMRDVPQAPSLSRHPVRRQILAVIGTVLLSFGCISIIVGLVWLTVCKMQGTLPNILDERAEMFLYAVTALLLVIAIVGAGFVATALSTPVYDSRAQRDLRLHAKFHG
jgi:ABC-type sulfate transport system permease subunit